MVLNGWILKPFEQNGHPGTWCCYYLQIDPQGLSPFPLATKMVSKRLSHIYKIEEYLKKHGQPRSAGTGQTNRKAANGQAAAGAAILSHSNGDARSGTDTSGQDTGSSLPPQAPFDDNNTSAKAVLQARQKVEQLLSNNVNWDKAVDPQGNPLYTQDVSGSSLPIMKGEARMPTGVTTEQVLGTMLSASARRICKQLLLLPLSPLGDIRTFCILTRTWSHTFQGTNIYNLPNFLKASVGRNNVSGKTRIKAYIHTCQVEHIH